MSMTLGRVSLNDDPWVTGPFRQRGDRVSIMTEIGVSSVDQAKAVMLQLRGLLDNPDEEIVPFTWTEDASFDGFYRVLDAQVEWTAATLLSGWCVCRLELERVGSTPCFETLSSLAVRTNSHGVTTPTGFVTSWFSGASYTMEIDPTATIGPLATEDGNVSGYQTTAPLATTSYLSWLKPADFYKTQARVEVKYGSTWYPIHGRHLPLGVGTDWRISNGRVRMYPSQVGGNGRFKVGCYPGVAWEEKEYGVTHSTTFNYATADSSGNAFSATVMVNRPEIVVVRTKNVATSFDWVVRRGQLWVEVAITQPASSTDRNWGIGVSTAEAATGFTGGIRATSTDADGNRYLLSCPSTVSTDTANGKLYLTSAADSAVFQVCPDYYLGGVGSDTGFRDYFLAARQERQRVVAR